MANSASVSGSQGYNIPVNALDGGDAAPSYAGPSGASTGSVTFGSLFVGSTGNSLGAQVATPGLLGGQPLSEGSSTASTSLLPFLLIGGAVLAWLMLKKKL